MRTAKTSGGANHSGYKTVKNLDRKTLRTPWRGRIRNRLQSGERAPSYRLYARSSTAIVRVPSPTLRKTNLQIPDRGLISAPSLTAGLLIPLRSPSPSGKCLRANRVCMSVGESARLSQQPIDTDRESQSHSEE